MEGIVEQDRVVIIGGIYGFKQGIVKGLKSFVENVMSRIANLTFVNEQKSRQVQEIMMTQKIATPKELALGNNLYNTRIYSYHSELDIHLQKMIIKKKLHIDSYLSSLEKEISETFEKTGLLSSEDDMLNERNDIWKAEDGRIKPNTMFSFESTLDIVKLEVKDPIYFYRDKAIKTVTRRPYSPFQIICAIGFQGVVGNRPVYIRDCHRIELCKNPGLRFNEKLFLSMASDLFCHDTYGHASDSLMTHPMNRVPKDFDGFLCTIGSIPSNSTLEEFENSCGGDYFIRNTNQVYVTSGEIVDPNCTILYAMLYGISMPIIIATKEIQADEELVYDTNEIVKEKEDSLALVSRLVTDSRKRPRRVD